MSINGAECASGVSVAVAVAHRMSVWPVGAEQRGWLGEMNVQEARAGDPWLDQEYLPRVVHRRRSTDGFSGLERGILARIPVSLSQQSELRVTHPGK